MILIHKPHPNYKSWYVMTCDIWRALVDDTTYKDWLKNCQNIIDNSDSKVAVVTKTVTGDSLKPILKTSYKLSLKDAVYLITRCSSANKNELWTWLEFEHRRGKLAAVRRRWGSVVTWVYEYLTYDEFLHGYYQADKIERDKLLFNEQK